MKRYISTLPQSLVTDDTNVTGKEAREQSREVFRTWASATEEVIDCLQVSEERDTNRITIHFSNNQNILLSYHRQIF